MSTDKLPTGEALAPCPWCGTISDTEDEWGSLITHRGGCYWRNIHGDPIGRVRVNNSDKIAWNTRATSPATGEMVAKQILRDWAVCILHGLVENSHRCRDYDGEDFGMSIHRIKSIVRASAATLPAADYEAAARESALLWANRSDDPLTRAIINLVVYAKSLCKTEGVLGMKFADETVYPAAEKVETLFAAARGVKENLK